ncbi:MAG TPA: glycosyltransferase [Polyangia bacterium]|nr:glycosyltransferase [Polyangia bacterium]
MSQWLSIVLVGIAAAGVALLAVQLGSTRNFLRAPPGRPRLRPGISVLKPLCGLDDDLAANLASFAALDYPDFEILLGVKDRRDSAYPVARAIAAQWPERFRVIVQRGLPGKNPKVNQLITLAAAARHSILVVSDSNIRVGRRYLDEIAHAFEDPRVGMVSHAIAGAGERRLGALLDNLHLACHVGPGVIAAKRVAGQDIVIGKSMSLKRDDLRALGGFEAVKDVLAEDYVLGRRMSRELGKRCAIAARPVVNVSRERSVGDFVRRYRRWSVIHRQAVGTPTYLCEAFLNPLLFALAAVACSPALWSLAALGGVCVCKVGIDVAAARGLRGRGAGRFALLVVPAKDLLIGAAWLYGLVVSTVEWRGNRLRVLPGTRLESPPDERGAREQAEAC